MRLGPEEQAAFFREDPLSGDWVLFAPGRGGRPNAFIRSPREQRASSPCPFCPGNEHETPPEITRRGNPGKWTIRVIPNRYSALSDGPGGPLIAGGVKASGPHEVIIDAPGHIHLDEMAPEAVAELFEVYAERVKAIRSTDGVRAVVLFKNDGENAGESIHHPHTQLLGLPLVPERIERMARRFNSGCPLCAELGLPVSQSRNGGRVIHANDSFVMVSPFAPRRAYEAWVVPMRHVGSIDELSREELRALAGMTRAAVGAVRKIASGTSFNICCYQALGRASASFHLYIEVAPRRSTMGGFELETGIMINVVTPEDAAAKLRSLVED